MQNYDLFLISAVLILVGALFVLLVILQYYKYTLFTDVIVCSDTHCWFAENK
jgi:hypothetical protein